MHVGKILDREKPFCLSPSSLSLPHPRSGSRISEPGGGSRRRWAALGLPNSRVKPTGPQPQIWMWVAPCCCPLRCPGWLLPWGVIHPFEISWPPPGSLPGSPSSHATHGRHGLSRALSSSTPVFLSSASFHPRTPSGAASAPPPPRDQRNTLSSEEPLSSPREGKWQEGSQASEEVNLMAQRWPTAQEASLSTAHGSGHWTRQQGGQEAARGCVGSQDELWNEEVIFLHLRFL